MSERAGWESDRMVRQLRRRLWLERAVWLALLAGLSAVHYGWLPGGRSVVLIAADSSPVAVVENRAQAQRLLDSLKEGAGQPLEKVEFAEKVTLHPVPAARNPAQSERDALAALAARLTPVVRAAAIVVNGEVVVALPDQQEAVRTLSQLLQEFSPPGDNASVYFKEQVRVEVRAVAPAFVYPSAARAVTRIAEAAQPKAEHRVRPGDSAWKIAQDHGTTLARLAAANPEVDLDRISVGARLKIPGELPPVTVVARKEVQERVGAGPQARARRVRITYENRVQVSREVLAGPMPEEDSGEEPRPARRPGPARGDGE